MKTPSTYTNPVIAGDYADPSIVRVDRDYYLVQSSFRWAPGFLIWHSRDLAHWSPVTYALPKGDGDVWAPDLVYHEGQFLIYYYSGEVGDIPRGTRVITAPHIAGPWSEPVLLGVAGIDPCHVIGTDGKRYLFVSEGYKVPLGDDGLKTVGPREQVYHGWPIPREWRVEGFAAESPKLIFKDGWYHLFTAQGGTAGPSTSHMVVHARARQLDGPWENSPLNPIIRTGSRAETWWSRGHGTVFDTPSGEWYIIYHGYKKGYHTLGRQTLLQPAEWTKDGWLRITGEPDQPLPLPRDGQTGPHDLPRSDEFQSPTLGLQWRFWDGFDATRFEVGDGRLRLRSLGTSPTDGTPMTLLAVDEAYSIQVDVEVEAGNRAGLVLYYSPEAYVGIGVSSEGVWKGQLGKLHLAKTAEPVRRATLKIVNDHQEVDFYVSINDGPLEKREISLEVSGYQHNTFGGFFSLRPGLYSAGEGWATFRHFHYEKLSDTVPAN